MPQINILLLAITILILLSNQKKWKYNEKASKCILIMYFPYCLVLFSKVELF